MAGVAATGTGAGAGAGALGAGALGTTTTIGACEAAADGAYGSASRCCSVTPEPEAKAERRAYTPFHQKNMR